MNPANLWPLDPNRISSIYIGVRPKAPLCNHSFQLDETKRNPTGFITKQTFSCNNCHRTTEVTWP